MKTTSEQRPSSHVQSVERAITILELLAGTDWAGVTDVGVSIGVHKSTASRLLTTLESRGLVEQHATSGKYRLGYGLVHLADGVSARPDVTSRAKDACQWLAGRSEETVTLAVLEDGAAVTIDQIVSTATVASRSWLGRRTPLHCTSPGKVFLAYLDEAQPLTTLAGPHERWTEHTITDPAHLAAELDRVRTQGYATTSEELEDGLSAAAAPVRASDGSVVAAIGISGPSYRLGPAQLEQAAVLVREAAELASGGGPGRPSGPEPVADGQV